MIDIQKIPEVKEQTIEIVAEKDVKESDNIRGKMQRGKTTYCQVDRVIVTQTEGFRVWTSNRKVGYTYTIRKDDNDNWKVVDRTKKLNRDRWSTNIPAKSTETVRQALREKYGIELEN